MDDEQAVAGECAGGGARRPDTTRAAAGAEDANADWDDGPDARDGGAVPAGAAPAPKVCVVVVRSVTARAWPERTATGEPSVRALTSMLPLPRATATITWSAAGRSEVGETTQTAKAGPAASPQSSCEQGPLGRAPAAGGEEAALASAPHWPPAGDAPGPASEDVACPAAAAGGVGAAGRASLSAAAAVGAADS